MAARVVVVQVKAAGTLPKEKPPPPLFSSLLFTSLSLMYLFISLAPPSLHPVSLVLNLSFLRKGDGGRLRNERTSGLFFF